MRANNQSNMLAKFKASIAQKKTAARSESTLSAGKKRKRPANAPTQNSMSAGQDNWKALLQKKRTGPLVHYNSKYSGPPPPGKKSKRAQKTNTDDTFVSAAAPTTNLNAKHVQKTPKEQLKPASADKDNFLAMDCEMVGVGSDGKRSVLARCSVVNYDEEVVYDKFVQCVEHITDFREYTTS